MDALKFAPAPAAAASDFIPSMRKSSGRSQMKLLCNANLCVPGFGRLSTPRLSIFSLALLSYHESSLKAPLSITWTVLIPILVPQILPSRPVPYVGVCVLCLSCVSTHLQEHIHTNTHLGTLGRPINVSKSHLRSLYHFAFMAQSSTKACTSFAKAVKMVHVYCENISFLHLFCTRQIKRSMSGYF